MSKTQDNLLGAFAGESQANRKYVAFAAVAEKEGHKGIARLFRATAEAETVHALEELKLAGKVSDTKANLSAAIKGETYEFTTMYPNFQKDAKDEGKDGAYKAFEYAKESEKVHAKLYKEALDNLGKGEDVAYYLCPVCGYIEKGAFPANCPICKAKGSSFKKF
ncbi:MAG: rubrerythrin family protein [Synergistaceae bacterium]|jgi:rubrerythrin|nr:rubrerythrin family protein [Synergistaceae bacterium]